MSSILLKQVQSNTITPPPNPGYVKIYSDINDSGKLYYKDYTGTIFLISDLSSTPTTYSDLVSALIPGNELIPGSFYTITDFKTVYDRPNFFMDGTIKTIMTTHIGPTHPLIVFATSTNTVSAVAYQPDFPNDTIKFDINWSITEINYSTAYGRISERIDEYGNRTDFDHRVVEHIRYQSYDRVSKLTGQIQDVDFTNGTITGNLTNFTGDLLVDDIILLDTFSNLNYNIGLKIKTIISDTSAEFYTDISFGGVQNGVNADFYSSTATGNYYDWKEVYVAQEGDGDYQEFKTFQTDNESPVSSLNNFVDDFYQYYTSNGLTYRLPNIVFHQNSNANKVGVSSYNITFPQNSSNNIISSNFNSNLIYNNFNDNTIRADFENNILFSDFEKNDVQNDFSQNSIGTQSSSFSSNKIGNVFSQNHISGNFYKNDIGEEFSNNTVEDNFVYNTISNDFNYNSIYENFQYNIVKVPVTSVDFTSNFGNIVTFTTSAAGGSDGTYTLGGTNQIGGIGVSASFDIVVISSSVSSIGLTNSGKYYVPGDTITIDGTLIGGTTVVDDVTITVSTISATPSVYENYTCEIFNRQGPSNRLMYFDSSDVLIIKDING